MNKQATMIAAHRATLARNGFDMESSEAKRRAIAMLREAGFAFDSVDAHYVEERYPAHKIVADFHVLKRLQSMRGLSNNVHELLLSARAASFPAALIYLKRKLSARVAERRNEGGA